VGWHETSLSVKFRDGGAISHSIFDDGAAIGYCTFARIEDPFVA
jgi:hypothetical protein